MSDSQESRKKRLEAQAAWVWSQRKQRMALTEYHCPHCKESNYCRTPRRVFDDIVRCVACEALMHRHLETDGRSQVAPYIKRK